MFRKVLNVVSILFGLLLINGGLNKFLNYMPVPEGLPVAFVRDNEAFLEISWLMPLVAIAELIGGILIMIPTYRALGALIVFPVMVGVLLVHVTVAPEGLPIALVIWAILGLILIDNRKKYKQLFR
jgi:uncharacterized membrane protein YphA (DoxX/SURF4 family)